MFNRAYRVTKQACLKWLSYLRYETNSNQHQTCLLWATALVNLCVDFILWPSCNHSFKELWMIPAIKRLATKHPFFFIAGKMCSKENPEVLRESHSHQADFQNHPFICWKPRQRCSDWTWGKRSLYTSYPKRKKKKPQSTLYNHQCLRRANWYVCQLPVPKSIRRTGGRRTDYYSGESAEAEHEPNSYSVQFRMAFIQKCPSAQRAQRCNHAQISVAFPQSTLSS